MNALCAAARDRRPSRWTSATGFRLVEVSRGGQHPAESLTEAAKSNRYGHRDATMILMACRHGFRSSELIDLRSVIDFDRAALAVRWVKQGSPSTPFRARSCVRCAGCNGSRSPSPFVFTWGRGSHFTTAGFAKLERETVNRLPNSRMTFCRGWPKAS
jgi:hypothetical protein